RRLQGHQGPVTRLAFAGEGRALLSIGEDKTLRRWDVATGKELRRFAQHKGAVRPLGFSPDGDTLVSQSFIGSVCVWDTVTGKERLRVRPPGPEGKEILVGAVAISPDGKRLAIV